ncbi:hypothetical protein [Acinetobacter beijerinckii]|uniref:Uncharacterized protein n=1 Tax=Acinetobacter beijerinckii ANC 3835 TaxID=1217649 RepID=N9FH24_9GAMM|nr:hypothetical protein [Acinetobacter beijerinckii]ENW06600.1 hypothetical protein F934_00558 [Acinetobacter beijerinckii ANC 3835]
MSSYQNENSKLLWMIIGGISVVVVLIFAIQWFFSEKHQETSITSIQPTIEKTVTPSVTATTESAEVANETPAPIQLVEESIVKEPIPTNDTLAKEEITKLDDIHQQLKDQQQDLKQQHTDVDTLLKLKEDQVKLLEAQLAAQNKP